MFGIPKILQQKLVKAAAEKLKSEGHEYLIIRATDTGELEIYTPVEKVVVNKTEYDFLKKVYENSLTIKK